MPKAFTPAELCAPHGSSSSALDAELGRSTGQPGGSRRTASLAIGSIRWSVGNLKRNNDLDLWCNLVSTSS